MSDQVAAEAMHPKTIKPGKRTYKKRTVHDARRVGVVAAQSAVGASDEASPVRVESDSAPIRRISRDDREVNTYELPRHLRKPGWDYQWVAFKVMGQPMEDLGAATPGQFENYGGWRVERAKDWPGVVDPGIAATAAVEKGGQRLYGRPKALSAEARQEDYDAAERQKRDRIDGALQGRPQGGGGVADIKGVRARPMELVVEGEVGSYGGTR